MGTEFGNIHIFGSEAGHWCNGYVRNDSTRLCSDTSVIFPYKHHLSCRAGIGILVRVRHDGINVNYIAIRQIEFVNDGGSTRGSGHIVREIKGIRGIAVVSVLRRGRGRS